MRNEENEKKKRTSLSISQKHSAARVHTHRDREHYYSLRNFFEEQQPSCCEVPPNLLSTLLNGSGSDQQTRFSFQSRDSETFNKASKCTQSARNQQNRTTRGRGRVGEGPASSLTHAAQRLTGHLWWCSALLPPALRHLTARVCTLVLWLCSTQLLILLIVTSAVSSRLLRVSVLVLILWFGSLLGPESKTTVHQQHIIITQRQRTSLVLCYPLCSVLELLNSLLRGARSTRALSSESCSTWARQRRRRRRSHQAKGRDSRNRAIKET